jgi:hypothetical protein
LSVPLEIYPLEMVNAAGVERQTLRRLGSALLQLLQRLRKRGGSFNTGAVDEDGVHEGLPPIMIWFIVLDTPIVGISA